MSEFKLSSYPWNIDSNGEQVVITNSDESKAVAFIPPLGENSESDRVLISCAPEMLDMLINIYKGAKHLGITGLINHIEIEQLIKKATTI